MAIFRIHRLKETVSQQFRWAPHVSGVSQVKRKDYEEAGELEASNEYDAWQRMRQAGQELQVGDILETASGELRICKYVGFDPAEWVLPPVKTGLEELPAAAVQPAI
jgi:hypothetical protein